MQSEGTSPAASIVQARARIADMLMEMDDIELQQNPRILAEYATTIGYLENDLLKWQIAARRSKRRVALAQAQANRGGVICREEVEGRLDAEFAEWAALLAKSTEEFLQAVERKGSSKALSPSQSREVKRLHRLLVKRLHPDLHPGQGEEATRFFAAAQAAFEAGNLATLRAIAVATEGMGEGDGLEGLSEEELEAELAIARAQEKVTAEGLERLKTENPYALKAKLEDGAWVIRRTDDLKRQIGEQKAAVRAFDERYARLVGDGGNGI